MKSEIEEVVEQEELKIKKQKISRIIGKHFLEGLIYTILFYTSIILFIFIRSFGTTKKSFAIFCIYGLIITLISWLFNRERGLKSKLKSLLYTILTIITILLITIRLIVIGAFGWLVPSSWMIVVIERFTDIEVSRNGMFSLMAIWPIMFMILGRLISEIKIFKGKEKGENNVSNKV